MVRVAVRTITLNVYRGNTLSRFYWMQLGWVLSNSVVAWFSPGAVDDDPMKQYLCEGPDSHYPTHLVLYLRAEVLRLHAMLTSG